jgi:dethiobiotin synthetase
MIYYFVMANDTLQLPRVKAWCSHLRKPGIRTYLSDLKIVHNNHLPREGDLVITRSLGCVGAYDGVEDPSGRKVRLYEGDYFVAVLGTRKSGTNLTGSLPVGPLCSGAVLSLIAWGGLIGECTCVPKYYGSRALPVEVVGFFEDDHSNVVNLRDLQSVSPAGPISQDTSIVFVAGTSAEVGKTTFLCEMIRSVRESAAEANIAGIKAAGTGRMQDNFRYLDAGAELVLDFVDAGWPSTYNIPEHTYKEILTSLIDMASRQAGFVFVELGGDLFEARVPEAISIAVELSAPVLLCVNDALGAVAGLEILTKAGVREQEIATMRQNPLALQHRLNLPRVIGPGDKTALFDFAGRARSRVALQ